MLVRLQDRSQISKGVNFITPAYGVSVAVHFSMTVACLGQRDAGVPPSNARDVGTHYDSFVSTV